MNKFKISVVLLFVFILTGCNADGGEVQGSLVINEDGSGTRTVSIIIEKSELSEYINGDIEDIVNVIKTNKPFDDIKIEYTEGINEYYLYAIYNFDDIDDYTQKTRILTDDYDFYCDFDYNVGAMGKGVHFEESRSLESGASWMIDAISASNLTTESRSELYNLGDYIINVPMSGDVTYNYLSSPSYIDNVIFPYEIVEIKTTLKEDLNIDREIVVSISDMVYGNIDSVVLQEYLDEVLGGVTYSEEEGLHSYTANYAILDENIQRDLLIMGSSVLFEEDINSSPIGKKYIFSENVNLTDILQGSEIEQGIKYYLEVPQEYIVDSNLASIEDGYYEFNGESFDLNANVVSLTNISTIKSEYTFKESSVENSISIVFENESLTQIKKDRIDLYLTELADDYGIISEYLDSESEEVMEDVIVLTRKSKESIIDNIGMFYVTKLNGSSLLKNVYELHISDDIRYLIGSAVVGESELIVNYPEKLNVIDSSFSEQTSISSPGYMDYNAGGESLLTFSSTMILEGTNPVVYIIAFIGIGLLCLIGTLLYKKNRSEKMIKNNVDEINEICGMEENTVTVKTEMTDNQNVNKENDSSE